MAEPVLALDVVEQAGDWSGLATEDLLAAVPAALAAHVAAAGVVTVALADDAAVRALNARYRGKDAPTNVLSFPGGGIGVPGEHAHLGDVILARETLAREAALEGKPEAHHFIHLVIHGILHVMGHDHIDENDAERMETLEVEILRELGVADPYAETNAAT